MFENTEKKFNSLLYQSKNTTSKLMSLSAILINCLNLLNEELEAIKKDEISIEDIKYTLQSSIEDIDNYTDLFYSIVRDLREKTKAYDNEK